MKRLIYQVSVGQPSELYKWCIESTKKYCEKYDIDHIVQTEPILKIGPLNWEESNRSDNVKKFGYLPIYEKENAFGYFDEYDQIAIVDSDIYIRPTAPNIFDDLNEDADFGGVIEREMPLTQEYTQKIIHYSQAQYHNLETNHTPNQFGYEFYNMGLMVMNKSITKYINGDTPEQFIRRPEFKKFVDGIGYWKWSTDQTLLNYWVRKSGMKQQHLSWKWNALFKGIKDDWLPKAQFIHFFLKDRLPNKGENTAELERAMNNLPNDIGKRV